MSAARSRARRAPSRHLGWALALLGAALLGGRSADAQIAFVQSSGLFGTAAGTKTTSSALASNPKVGDTIVVLLWTWTENTAPAITISDNAGNTYTTDATATILQSGWYESAEVYSTTLTKSAASFTVTATLTGNDSASQIRGVVLEYSGIGGVDQTNAVTGTGAAASVSTLKATQLPNELVVADFGVDNPADNFTSIKASAGFTIRAQENQNAGDTAGAGADATAATTGIQSATFTVSPTLSGWAAAIATFKPGGALPDHFAIGNAGTAINCAPSPVTITAMSAAQAPVATTATIAIATSTGHGDWVLTSGGGTFIAGASNSGTATYTYVPADNGVVTLALRDTYPETLSINVADGTITQSSGSALPSQQLPLTFVPSGFITTNGANLPTAIGTQRAGVTSTQSLALQAVRTDTKTGACRSVFASGTTVNVGLALQCNNPTSCVAGQTFTVANSGVTTAIAMNPNGALSTYTGVPLTFSTVNAEAPIAINYSDAGQVTLAVRYNIPLQSGTGSGNLMTGTAQFVVQPYTLQLSNIACTIYAAGTCATTLAAPGANPGATSAAGPAFIPAGAPFKATVTALNFNNAATPNFGQETTPATVTLAANLLAPAGGDAALLNNASSFGAFSGGAATGTAFNWPEVGIITLTPGVLSYLSSGPVTGTTSGNVGRFTPASFGVALNTPVFGTGCSAGSFSYLGQPLTFTVAPVATVTALNTSGVPTRNYTGPFLKLTNSTLTGRTYTPTPASPALNLSGLPASGADPTIADLGTGQATLTFSAGTGIAYARGSALAPFNADIALSINVIDADGVSATNPVIFGAGNGIAFSTGAAQYYGRLALRDSVGSELLNLPMPLTTQYYYNTTVGFTLNTADSCTGAPALAFSNYQQNLTAGQTCVLDSGRPGVSGQGCAAPAPVGSRYQTTAVGGDFGLILAAPGGGNNGALSVTATAPGWLQYPSPSGMNPYAIGTFGVFPAPASRVHQREVY